MSSDQPRRRVKLADVAAAAGVSPMTVSRVVRNEKSVAKATRKKVREAIERLGYHPDPVLSALASYRTREREHGDGSTLAIITCDESAYSRDVFRGALEEAVHLGYRIEIHPLPSSAEKRRHLGRVLYHRGIRGLLIGPSDEEVDFESFPFDQFASVSLGVLVHKPSMHAVAMDYFHGAFTACRRLREMGCSRIGFAVYENLEIRTGHRWLGGYLAGIGGQEPCVYRAENVMKTFPQWCRRHRVDGLLTIHYEIAKLWKGEVGRCLLLNEHLIANYREMADRTHLSLKPETIGTEGVRLLHNYLLRQDYGIPASPRLSLLRGEWRDA